MALELDSSLAMAHAVLLHRACSYEFDRGEAERRIAAIAASEAVSAWVQAKTAASLFVLGRTEEAMQRFERSLEEDPLHLVTKALPALALSALGKHAEAEKQLLSALEVDANFHMGNNLLASLYASQGKFEAALPFAQRAHESGPWRASDIGQYAVLLSLLGHKERSAEVLKKMPPPERYGTAMGWAMYHLLRNDLAVAAHWFEKVFDERMPELKLRILSAVAASLHSSPYWPRLANIMNLPPLSQISGRSDAVTAATY